MTYNPVHPKNKQNKQKTKQMTVLIVFITSITPTATITTTGQPLVLVHNTVLSTFQHWGDSLV